MKPILVSMLFVYGILRAEALVISEIMYDPQGTNDGRHWIEVFNDTGDPVDLTTWKFFEANVNHGIVLFQGGPTLPAGSYAVIADNPVKFKADYEYAGILYDSSFSLSTGGEALSLKETKTSDPAYTVDYSQYVSVGGDNDGSTLSFIASEWVRGKATPGAENTTEEKIVEAETSPSATGAQLTIAQMSPPAPDVVLYLPTSKIAVAGAETEFKVSGGTRSGKAIDDLRYTWAFGDGGRGTGSSTHHTYAYTGRYIAQVEGVNNSVIGIGRITVKVVPPDVSIEDVGQGRYGTYVDVKNPNAYELDVSGWALSLDGAVYPFPHNTVIPANTTIRFSGASMGFANMEVRDGMVVKVQFPNLEEVTRYVPAVANPIPQLVVATRTPTIAVSSRPQPKTKNTAPKVLGVATTSVRVSTSTAAVPSTARDKRLITWFRSLFSK